MEVDRKPFAFSLFLASDETVLYLGRFFLLRCCASSSLSTLDDSSFLEKGEHVSLSVTDDAQGVNVVRVSFYVESEPDGIRGNDES